MLREDRRPTKVQLRCKAERERRRRRKAAKRKLPTLGVAYADRPIAYIEEKLGWSPWEGADDGRPGQVEIIEAYRHAIRQQIERRDYDAGLVVEQDLKYWRPGQTIRNELHVQAGHGLGKSKLLSGLINHFLDCFPPSIIYTFAPSANQLNLTTWKEIKIDRRGKGLPGRVLPVAPKIVISDNHFAIGRTTNNAKGLGTENTHGQHGPFLMFVLDEAEGVPDYVYDAIQGMKSGGIVIVIRVGNPKTRTSRFYRSQRGGNVRRFRMNSIDHPNVRAGREVVPNAVTRAWVEEMLGLYADVVDEHDEDAFTFTLTWAAHLADPEDETRPADVYPPGTIFRPSADFLWRVMGIAPPTGADKTLIPVGRYEAAVKRGLGFRPQVQAVGPGDMTVASIGCDGARFGLDKGTIYVRQGNLVWRAGAFGVEDYDAYDRALTKIVAELIAAGVRRIDLRIDGGGGYGGGIAALIKKNAEIRRMVKEAGVQFQLREVLNQWAPTDGTQWANLITELYGAAAEAIRDVAIIRPVPELEIDLTARRFAYQLKGVRDTKALEKKEAFRDREKHSPDDGDGFVLAVAPTSLLGRISAMPGRSHTYFTFN